MALHRLKCSLITLLAGLLALAGILHAADRAQDPTNLALKKPATASSVENDEHNAAAANDGDDATDWISDDVPGDTPDWWQVDLEKPHDLTGCRIRWPYDGKKYQYKVEGSADGKQWMMLSDQTKSTRTTQVHELKFEHAQGMRFVRITVTGVEEGCWPDISEVQVFGK